MIQFGQDSGVTTKHARYTKVIERNFVYFVVVTYLGIRLFLPLDFLSDCFERTRNCKRLIVSVVATAAIGSGAALACLWRPDPLAALGYLLDAVSRRTRTLGVVAAAVTAAIILSTVPHTLDAPGPGLCEVVISCIPPLLYAGGPPVDSAKSAAVTG